MTLLAMPVVVGRSELLNAHLKRFNRTLRGLERGDIRMLHAARRDHSGPLSRLAVTVARERDEARQELAGELPVREMRRLGKRLAEAAAALASREERHKRRAQ